MEYRGQTHNEMFTLAIKNRKNANFRYLSVVYLLTADKNLWSICKNAVSENSVDFSLIRNTGIYLLLPLQKQQKKDVLIKKSWNK